MIQEVDGNNPLVLIGNPLVEKMKLDQTEKINKIKRYKDLPSLLVFADFDHAPSKLYVNKKIDYCCSLGLKAEVIDLSTKNRAEARWILNSSKEALLVQLPLPENHRDLDKLVPDNRDVEGFNPKHLGKLVSGNLSLYPCTAAAIINLLLYYRFDFKGARVCIINDSLVVGKPLAMAISHLHGTPIICNKYTKDLQELTRIADLIVTAVGSPNFSLKSDMIKEKAWVVDVGCRRLDNGKVIGDLEVEARSKCAAFAPAIGGVGPVTVAQVVSNILELENN